MDGLDLVGIATLAQAAVLGATMVILILQFRSQEKATKDAAYQAALNDYNDTIRLLVTRPELAAVADDMVKTLPGGQDMRGLSTEQKLIQNYFLMLYGLMERVYLLYSKRWIDAATWQEWETWLAYLAKHPLFGLVHRVSGGMFDAAFQEHVERLMGPSIPDTTGRPELTPKK